MSKGDNPSDNKGVAVVVLAAGLGKRMKSDLPKVLHRVCGKPIVDHVLDRVGSLDAGEVILVVGRGSDEVRSHVGEAARCVDQAEQLGTGHAVMVALDGLDPRFDEILVLPGDSPLIETGTLQGLIDVSRNEKAAAAVLTAELPDPTGYGRVMRDGRGGIERIVEETDATAGEREVSEVNACTYAFDRSRLEKALGSITKNNSQGEYYLTEVVELLVRDGSRVVPVAGGAAEEALGINDREQLATVDAILRGRKNRDLMLSGVTIVEPGSTYIDFGVEVGRDTVIMPLVFITGRSTIGSNCRIGPCTAVNDATVEDSSEVEFSWLDGCELGQGVKVGPYSRLRQGCRIGPGARIGSFVELKNTVVGRGSKVPHLSYMGDAVIGEDVNVGAGSITCNYDGENKHTTEIDDRAFIGSDTMLIAPVRIGKDTVTAAGSSIYRDVPDGNLGVERCEQKNVPDYRERKNKKRKHGRKPETNA